MFDARILIPRATNCALYKLVSRILIAHMMGEP